MPQIRLEIRLNREERKQQTRERLLDAAARVFGRIGFGAASLDEVAEAAGFTKGAVYSNFRSKSDLFIALIGRRLEREVGKATAQMRGRTLQEMLAEAAAEPEVAASADDREWMALSCQFWLHALNDEQAREALARVYERARAVNVEVLTQKYAEAGLELPIPAREYAILAEAIGLGVVFQHMIDPKAVPLSIATRGLLRLLGHPAGPEGSLPDAQAPSASEASAAVGEAPPSSEGGSPTDG